MKPSPAKPPPSLVGIVPFLFVVTLLFGCADQNPVTGPSSEVLGDPVEVLPEEGLVSVWPLDHPARHNAEGVRSVVIDAKAGGQLQSGRVRLDFPPGALTEDTEITIVNLKRADEKVYFELLPHGLQFQIPVSLTVYLGGTGVGPHDDLRQYWWDTNTGEWVDIGGAWQFPSLVTSLDHFSRYRTGRAGW